MARDFVIGADIGTGSCKAVAITSDGKVLAETQNYYTTNHPKPGYSEQDPDVIFDTFISTLQQMMKKVSRVPIAVSLSSAMHSLVLINKKGKAITPLITWEDSRSHKEAAALRKSDEGRKIYRVTGTPIHSMSPLCKIIWFRKNKKRVFNKAYKFIGIKEYIWFKLFNEYQTDISVASATGLFSTKKMDWHPAALKRCSVSREQLPEIVDSHYTRDDMDEKTAKQLGLSQTTPFCIGANDGCLANLGTNALKKGVAAITISTSGAVRIATDKPISDFDSMLFNYLLTKKIIIAGGPINNGGNVLLWLINTFYRIENPDDNDFDELYKNIDTVPPACDGLICLPYIYGERAPVWDEKASGLWMGIKAWHTEAHFLRAAIEGICFNLKSILKTLEKRSNTIRQLHLSGGAFGNSKMLMQMLADITGKKIVLTGVEDASATGAAMMGFEAIKKKFKMPSSEKNKLISLTPISENAEAYKRNYRVFKKLYPILKKDMHQISVRKDK